MLKAQNSEIVDFLPKADDISKEITKVTDNFLNEVGKLDIAMNK